MPDTKQTVLEQAVADQWKVLPSGLTVLVRPKESAAPAVKRRAIPWRTARLYDTTPFRKHTNEIHHQAMEHT